MRHTTVCSAYALKSPVMQGFRRRAYLHTTPPGAGAPARPRTREYARMHRMRGSKTAYLCGSCPTPCIFLHTQCAHLQGKDPYAT